MIDYDVGHPTAYFWLLAVYFKVFGVGPAAGHLLTWAFSALLAVSIYGLGRCLDLPRPVSVIVALATSLYPIMWSSHLQILSDLPMTAAGFAALYFWIRKRYWGYFGLASLALLTKFHGFLFLLGPLISVLFCSGAFWRKENWKKFLKETAVVLSPLLSLFGFLLARSAVRGTAPSVGYDQSHFQFKIIWNWTEFRANLPRVVEEIYLYPRILWFLGISVLFVLIGVAIDGMIRRREQTASWIGSKESSRWRATLTIAGFFAAYNAAFLQITSVLPRYTLPNVPIAFLGIGFGLLLITRKPAVPAAVLLIMTFFFPFMWKPRWAEPFPRPLEQFIRANPIAESHNLEIDLRFLDAVRLLRWTAEEIREDAATRGIEMPVTGGQWPITPALARPEMGYLEKGIPTRDIMNWEEAAASDAAYIVVLEPVTYMPPNPPPEFEGIELVDERKVGEITAWIWRKENNLETP